jgi:hypothetical protein
MASSFTSENYGDNDVPLGLNDKMGESTSVPIVGYALTAEIEQERSAELDHTRESRREQERSNALAAANENTVAVGWRARTDAGESTTETQSGIFAVENSSMVALPISNDETCETLNDTLESVNLSQGNSVAYVEGDNDGNPTASLVPVAMHVLVGAHPDVNATLISALENRGRIIDSTSANAAADDDTQRDTDAEHHALVLQDVNIMDDLKQDPQAPNFCMGDHVYQWCGFAGLPAVYQHHGVVMDVFFREGEWMLQIADFSNWMPDENEDAYDSSGSGNKMPLKTKSLRSNCPSTGGCIRTYHATADDTTWHKVVYQASMWKQHLWRSGTCTAASCDAPGMVRARVQFLQEHAELLPPYSVVQSNCECVAVWCKTGTWATLQATSWLSVTAAGQAKSTATLAGVVTTTQVSVPSAGLWGWFGYTTHVSLAATQPYLLPAIAAYGVVTVGTPFLWLLHAKQKWKNLTILLNERFWEAAVDHPDIFVDNITHWSSQHDPAESSRCG